MSEQNKALVDRARALLAAVTELPPKPDGHGTLAELEWTACHYRPHVQAQKALRTAAPELITTLCDAVVDAERRAEEAEAGAAAMREPLSHHASVRMHEHRGELHSARQMANGCLCRWCLTGRALAVDAGRAILDRLAAAESERDALRATVEDLDMRARMTCEDCLGTGEGDEDGPCEMCDGRTWHWRRRYDHVTP